MWSTLRLRSDPDTDWEPSGATKREDKLVPLELKVLGALRVLGRSWVFGDVCEATGMGETTMREFFKKWTSSK
jgi:hypothetical protein